jgi:RimJ/RimL family protein N-acetyltransferase
VTTFLSGSKVALRTLRRADLDIYRSWLENQDATFFMESGARPYGDAQMEDIFRSSTEAADTVVFVVETLDTKRPIGVVGLYLIHWICRRAEFRILIGEPETLGKGYGTEAAELIVAYAFDRLNLESVFLGVSAENKRAIASYEKANFQYEGTRRRHIYRNGRYYDAVLMSVLREEWVARKSS